MGSLLCEGVGSFLFFVLSFSFLFFCSFLFWYCGSLFFPFLSFSFCSFRFWYSGSKMAFKCCWWGDRPEWYSSFRSSGTNYFLKITDANVRCHGGQKKMGYSSSPSSSTPKSGRWLIISQTVLLGQIFLQLMLMGHFGPFHL